MFVARDWDEETEEKGEKESENSEEDCLVLFMIRLPDEVKNILGKDAKKLAAYGEELISGNKQKKGKQQKQVAQLEVKIKYQ